MGEAEIIKYIESGLARGIDLIEIKQSMFSRGWTDYDIEKALMHSGVLQREKEREYSFEQKEKKSEDNSIQNWDSEK